MPERCLKPCAELNARNLDLALWAFQRAHRFNPPEHDSVVLEVGEDLERTVHRLQHTPLPALSMYRQPRVLVRSTEDMGGPRRWRIVFPGSDRADLDVTVHYVVEIHEKGKPDG